MFIIGFIITYILMCDRISSNAIQLIYKFKSYILKEEMGRVFIRKKRSSSILLRVMETLIESEYYSTFFGGMVDAIVSKTILLWRYEFKSHKNETGGMVDAVV